MKYVIAIPSYNRAEYIGTLGTLAMLNRYGIPAEQIHVFVANETDYLAYKVWKDVGYCGKIVRGVLGLVPQRNYITNYYPDSMYVVQMDDDLQSFNFLLGKKQVVESGYALDQFLTDAYQLMKNSRAYIWGIGNTGNHFFMSNKVVTNKNYLLTGYFWGKINRHNMLLPPETYDYGEDIERSALYFRRDRRMVRFFNVHVKNSRWTISRRNR